MPTRWLLALILLLPLLPTAVPSSTLAQPADCLNETEPNNAEAEVQPIEGDSCIAGDLPTVDDQDLFLWTVSEADAGVAWSLAVDGPSGVFTSAKILPVASEPGVEPVVAGAQIGEVASAPDSDGPVSDTLLFSPGRYLIGVSRTVTAEGVDPLETTYQLDLARGDPLPDSLDDEPNDDPASASPVAGAFAASGDTLESVDLFAWTLSDDDAALGWELHLQAALGQTMTLTMTDDASGDALVAAAVGPGGRVDLYDLALLPGTYRIALEPASGVPTPYVLSANTAPRPTDDLEPNDRPASAATIDLANPIRKGRLAGTGDVDLYRLAVDDELAGSLFDIRLVGRGTLIRGVCITAVETGLDLQCKEGEGGAALANILLPRGDYLVRVTGAPDPEDPYILRVDVTTAPSADFESEPNDTEGLAATLDPAVPINGRFDGEEADAYTFTTEGEPQLWAVAVTGTGITQLDFTRRDGTELATGAVAPDGVSATLTDLYLPPGDHWLRVQGVDGEYAVALTPLGPPPVDGEREANNQVVLAEPMLLGETRTGRLAEIVDVDVFRFSLAADEHVLLNLNLPPDASVAVSVNWGFTRVGEATSRNPGEPIALDMNLHAGDYVVTLIPNQVSEGRYALTLSRGPFEIGDGAPLTGDIEPNDDPTTAAALTPATEVVGSTSETDVKDGYVIAPVEGRSLTFVLVSDGHYLQLSDEFSFLALSQSADDPTVWTADPPAPDDVPLFLEVIGDGPYTLTYAPQGVADGDDAGADDRPVIDLPGVFGDDPEPEPDSEAAASPTAEPAEDTPLDLTLTLDATEVAAYWHEGQVVTGRLTAANASADILDLELVFATTHFLLTVSAGDPPTSLEAGEAVEIPLIVTVQPDAWAGIPVQITAAALVDGQTVSSSVDLTPTADALPVSPFQAWPVPAELRGGLDLTSPTLGAVPAGTVDPTGEALLHDGVAPIGGGLTSSNPTLPLALSVDLAGDAPAPVAGLTIHSQPADGIPQHQVRVFELQLSTDGATFTTALTGELSALAREQVFVLDEPVEATHAQLLLLSTYDEVPTVPSAVSLGEWTVVAAPGFVPDTLTEIDVASAAFGGHVARWTPQPATPLLGIAMLTPDQPGDPIQAIPPPEDSAVEWVVAFQDNRAALVTELRWVDHPDSTEPNRLDQVDVEVSVTSASGPWTPAGEWDLDRAADGSVTPIQLDDPTWARFVRLSGTLPDDAVQLDYPAQLSIIEAPIDDDYRSVVGAWGATSPAASYEVANPPPSGTVADPADAPDDQASAADLDLGQTVTGYAQIGADVDWYRVTVGDGDNTLTFTLAGVPTVDVVVRVFDDAGQPVDVTREVLGDAASVAYTAPAEPGAAYTVSVEQPPHSIAVTFDTSLSLANYQPFVQQSLRSFAAGVREGLEFVQLVPFDEDPLLEGWTDDTYLIVSGINGYYDKSLSSSVETGVIDSTALLASREGATAILVITDAETGSYAEGVKMWPALDVTRPRVFAVHIGGSATPVLNEQLLQDLTSAGGYYQYTTNQAEMDRAFDRAATWLRRPTAYSLSVASTISEATPEPEPTAAPTPSPSPTPEPESTETPEPTEEPDEPMEPGSIAVVADPDDDGPAAPVSDQVTVEIILDTSGSMLAALPDGQLRIDVAQEVLVDLVTNQIPAGVPVALRVFGTAPDSCETSLLVPPDPLDPDAMAETIRAIEPVNLVKTPLGASLEQVADDLAGVDGPKVVVLVTDGEETCGGDPAASIRALAGQGIDVQVNIVGFALDDDALRGQFSEWAELGNGTYFDATSADELDEAIGQAVQAPFQVLDADGIVVASGTVGGNPVDVPPGTYDIVVLTDPERRLEDVTISENEEDEFNLEDFDD